MTQAIGDGIVFLCLTREFDKNSSEMAAWNKRLVLKANLYTICSYAFLVKKKSAIAGIEQVSIPAILIFAVFRIVSTCFQRSLGSL